MTILNKLTKATTYMSSAAIVTAIHNEVDTAQDKILAEAKEIIANTSRKEYLNSDKEIKLLEELGFINAKKVRELHEKNIAISMQNSDIDEILATAKKNADLIINYSVKYPQYKFITHDVINYLMDKYSLSIGPISAYMGEIPVKNLLELKNGKRINSEDVDKKALFTKLVNVAAGYDKIPNNVINALRKGIVGSHTCPYHIDVMTSSRLCEHVNANLFPNTKGNRNLIMSEFTILTFPKDFIIAPANHFDVKEMSKHTFNVKPKDPVVGTFVHGGALVKTKWGLEANDPELLNEIEN